MDPVSRQDFWKILSGFLAEGISIFVSTPYMDEAEHCHDLGLLHQGKLIAHGSPAQLRANMRMGSIIEVPVEDPLAALVPLEGLPEVIQTRIFGDKLHVLVWEADSDGQAMERALASLSLMAGPARAVSISLEDLFMLFLFAYSLNLDVKNIPLAVVDLDNSAEGRACVDLFVIPVWPSGPG